MSRLEVTVSPGAKRPGVVGRHGDGWKVRVACPPERGRANAELVELLSDCLGVPRKRLTVTRGRSSRLKILEVEGMSEKEVGERLSAWLRR